MKKIENSLKGRRKRESRRQQASNTRMNRRESGLRGAPQQAWAQHCGSPAFLESGFKVQKHFGRSLAGPPSKTQAL